MERGEWSSDQIMLTFFTLARDVSSSQRKWRLHSSTVLGRAARWLMTERVDEAPPPVACQARRPSVNCYPSAVFLRRLLHGSRVPAVWSCPDGLHQSLDSPVGNSVLRQSGDQASFGFFFFWSHPWVEVVLMRVLIPASSCLWFLFSIIWSTVRAVTCRLEAEIVAT